MKKYLKLSLWTLLLVAALWLVWKYEAKPFIAKLKGQTINPEDVTKAEKADIEVLFQTTGTFSAKLDEKISPKPSGLLQALYVQEGDLVKKGQTLALIKPGRNEFEDYKPMPITAPVSGKVVKCPASNYGSEDISTRNLSLPRLGTYLNGIYDNADKADCLLRIVDTKVLAIPMFASEQQVLKLKKGMEAEVKMAALGNEAPSLKGEITHISSQIEKSSSEWSDNKGFLIMVEIKNQNDDIWLGAKATIKIVTEKKQDVLTIPSNALFEKEGKYYVFVYLGNEKYEKKEIEIGLTNDQKIEVTNGLKEGEEVLTSLPYGESW